MNLNQDLINPNRAQNRVKLNKAAFNRRNHLGMQMYFFNEKRINTIFSKNAGKTEDT